MVKVLKSLENSVVGENVGEEDNKVGGNDLGEFLPGGGQGAMCGRRESGREGWQWYLVGRFRAWRFQS